MKVWFNFKTSNYVQRTLYLLTMKYTDSYIPIYHRFHVEIYVTSQIFMLAQQYKAFITAKYITLYSYKITLSLIIIKLLIFL